MKKLAAAKVFRGGRTARTWTEETTTVELDAGTASLRLNFSLGSKGGGITDVKLTIGPKDFSAMLGSMVSADRGSTTRAMAAMLAAELAKQPEHDREIARDARDSVLDAARRAYKEAPEGRNHAERLTRDMVEQLIEKLNEQDDAESADDEVDGEEQEEEGTTD